MSVLLCAFLQRMPSQSRIQIFVKDNQGGEDETRIDAIDLFGSTVELVSVCIVFVPRLIELYRTTRDLSGLRQQEE
jgi:hypothetical protein